MGSSRNFPVTLERAGSELLKKSLPHAQFLSEKIPTQDSFFILFHRRSGALLSNPKEVRMISELLRPPDHVSLIAHFPLQDFIILRSNGYNSDACSAILFQYLEYSTLLVPVAFLTILMNFSHFFFPLAWTPKNLVGPHVLKWLLYHHKFPKIPLNIALATLDFCKKNRPFLTKWKNQNRNFLPSAQTMVAPPWSQERVFTTLLWSK